MEVMHVYSRHLNMSTTFIQKKRFVRFLRNHSLQGLKSKVRILGINCTAKVRILGINCTELTIFALNYLFFGMLFTGKKTKNKKTYRCQPDRIK